MTRLSLILCLMLTPPAWAQDTLSAAEFDAFTKGKTLFYGTLGAPYGAEVYHDNRRVQWSFLDGECIRANGMKTVETSVLYMKICPTRSAGLLPKAQTD